MTPDLLIELSRLPLFPRTAADLCRVAGIEGAARIISAWGGREWPVPVRVGGTHPKGIQRNAQLCEIVGEQAAQRIVSYWGGGRLQIPNLKEVLWSYSQDKIREEFDLLTTTHGYTSPEAVFELGNKYGVTDKALWNALKRPDNVKSEPCAQGMLF